MATRQQQIDFVKQIYPAAVRLYNAGGIHPLFVTAQAALETGFQVKGIGNNILGITVGSKWTGPKSLELTTEYFSTPDKKFVHPERIVSKEQIGPRKWRYRVYRYFRVYDSTDACLDDHLALLKKPGYADAWPYRNDPKEYAYRLVDDLGARYATATDYAPVMANFINTVDRIVKANNL
ncbi:glucosaminidase domain-containing protein [uncultured Alistipes sp.]|jgi:flagellar rod assembly protein/muramidase flgJ|uniref:glucosaminidase domain-containing protein n=1 Tax=uncultured Alistipes sp. TaxID=538949 RepID=UPI0025FD89FB|nr:glucosaminidase domain-containing protein [uncultured Alistipes sp.]